MKSHPPENRGIEPPAAADEELLLYFISKREAAYNRISRFLHDEVGQVLSAVGLQLDALRIDFGEQAPELEQRTAEIQQMLEPAIGRIRDLSNELNASAVQAAGLHFALERLIVRVRERFPGSLRAQLDPSVRIPTDRAEALYRAAEAAMEIVTSSGCSAIDLNLTRDRTDFILEIRLNAPLDIKPALRSPALIMDYYANRNGIAVVINRAVETDTIIRFSCPVTVPEQSVKT